MELAQYAGGEGEQRRARKAARLASGRRAQAVRSRDGGVADDDPVEPVRFDRGADVVDLGQGQVRRDLQEHRPGAGIGR